MEGNPFLRFVFDWNVRLRNGWNKQFWVRGQGTDWTLGQSKQGRSVARRHVLTDLPSVSRLGTLPGSSLGGQSRPGSHVLDEPREATPALTDCPEWLRAVGRQAHGRSVAIRPTTQRCSYCRTACEPCSREVAKGHRACNRLLWGGNSGTEWHRLQSPGYSLNLLGNHSDVFCQNLSSQLQLTSANTKSGFPMKLAKTNRCQVPGMGLSFRLQTLKAGLLNLPNTGTL